MPASSIGISSPTSHWYSRLCISFLLKRHPKITLAVKDYSELAECNCIWNGVEEFSHRGTDDFLSVRSAKERKEYFNHTFGGMCIKRIHYFQLTLNHFIRSVLSKFIWIVLTGGSAKGHNNLIVNSSYRVNGLTFCWTDLTLKYYRELLVDI